MNNKKLVIYFTYDDIDGVYWADIEFNPKNMKEYGIEFAKEYGYEYDRNKYGESIIINGNYYSPDGLYANLQEFRDWLHNKFHFQVQEFEFI